MQHYLVSLSFSFCQLDDGVGDGGVGGSYLLHHHQSGAVDRQHVTRYIRSAAARWKHTAVAYQLTEIMYCNSSTC